MLQKLILLSVIYIVIFNGYTQAQLNYKPGCIVNNNNDTLSGFVNDGGAIRNTKYCLFKADKKSNSKKFYPSEIKSYRIYGERYYKSEYKNINKTDKQLVFMEVLIDGKYTLYGTSKSNNTMFYIKDGQNLIPLSKENYSVKPEVDGQNLYKAKDYKVEFQYYRDSLRDLFKGCMPVQQDIGTLEYTAKDIQKVTASYLNLSYENDGYISYMRDLNDTKKSVGVFFNISVAKISYNNLNLSEQIDADLSKSFPVGIFYNTPVNFISDRFKFQMELTLNRYKYTPQISNNSGYLANLNLSSTIIGIPIMLKYKIFRGNFSSTLGFGKEIGVVTNSKFQYLRNDVSSVSNQIYGGVDYMIHWQQKGGWFLDWGLSYRLNNKIGIVSGLRLQKHYNLIIENNYSNKFSFDFTESNSLGVKYVTEAISFRLGIAYNLGSR